MKYDEDVDRNGMRDLLESWGEQVKRSWQSGFETGQASAGQQPPRALVWSGMGGSAIGGDYCAALSKSSAPFPIIVHRGGPLPAWMNEQDRIVLVSFSGNTAETLETARDALQRGMKIDILTSGGKLASWGDQHGVSLWTVPGGRPPRSALGDLFCFSFGALCGRGWCRIDTEAVEEAINVVESSASTLGAAPGGDLNPLTPVMEGLANRFPMIYGTGCLTSVARRWANQINENSKRPAHWGELPEMNHNEVVAYVEGSRWSSEGALIILEDPESPADIRKRVDVTLELAEKSGMIGWVLGLTTRHSLGRVLGLTVMGDWLSYWIAIAEGTDPTPIPTIDTLKAALG